MYYIAYFFKAESVFYPLFEMLNVILEKEGINLKV